MLSNACLQTIPARGYLARGLVIALTVSAGGCSADVTRFDFPAFALTNSGAAPTTGSLAPPPQPLPRSYQSFDPQPPPRVSLSTDGGSGGSAGNDEGRAQARDYADPPPKMAAAPATDRFTARHIDRVQTAGTVAGETIVVRPGDTLYVLAKRHRVSIAALIELNGLRNGSSLRPGQQLVLPAGARHVRQAERAPEPAEADDTPAPATTAASPGGFDGQHTVKAGESLYGIARQHRVTLADLQRANAITEPNKIQVGAVLRIPGRAQSAQASRFVPTSTGAAPAARSRVINARAERQAKRREAALHDRATDAGPAEAGSGKFRWPVKGRIISGYGKRSDGTHNDGINLAVPQGTEIHAVEGGKVAYAGNELKGYGNLVLIRHDNGWVSAYAHADRLLVKRNDVVRRGQVIARAGRTGTVDQPQLHFELRQGAKPVDPLPHLEGN
jgi:murein DD-endopeptidase MepM/ murein hydrolase activator NlpD